jgi:Holliday junction resolvase
MSMESRSHSGKNAVADSPDDLHRLIQEVLAELGYAASPAEIANRVRRLNLGLPAEDEFSVICAWLGKCRLLHKLDQQQVPVASREAYQVADLLALFDSAGPFLIEVKSKAKPKLSFQADYLKRLTDYAALLRMPLLIAWKFHKIWTLFDVRHLKLARTNFNITLSDAMSQNLLGVLAGDVAFKLAPGAGIHFDLSKEKLVNVECHEDGVTEHWNMRISDAFITSGSGVRRTGLHAETQQLLAIWDLESREEHSANMIRMSFEVGTEGFQFAHMALPRLLEWERKSDGAQRWRRLLGAPEITRSITNFRTALDRALKEGIVSLVINQMPLTTPDFIRTPH